MASSLTSHSHVQWLPVGDREKTGKIPSDSRLFYGLDQQGHVLMATPFTLSCLGYAENQLENRQFLQLLHPEDREEMAMHLFFRFESNEDHRLVCRHLCQDGSYRRIRWDRVQELDEISYIFGAPVVAASDEASIFPHAFMEQQATLDEVATLRAELARTREELKSTREELEMLAFVISHDLRAPIRHIASYSELLKKRLPELSEDGEKFLLNIQRASQRLSDQTQGLVSYSRIGRWQLAPREVDLYALIQEVLQPYQDTIEARQVQLTFSHMETVMTDPHLLKVVLGEVIDNALKFTASSPLPQIQMDFTQRQHEWTLRISDNGIGFEINPDDTFGYAMRSLHHSRYHPEVGIGMGLARAKRAIGRLGGTLSGEGQEGLGAIVFLRVPATPPPSLASEAEPKTSSACGAKFSTI